MRHSSSSTAKIDLLTASRAAAEAARTEAATKIATSGNLVELLGVKFAGLRLLLVLVGPAILIGLGWTRRHQEVSQWSHDV
jgi:hypothetical protein